MSRRPAPQFTSDISRQVEFMRAVRGVLEERLAVMKVSLHYLDLIEEPSKIHTLGLKAYAIKGTTEHNESKRMLQFTTRFRTKIGDTEREDVEEMVDDMAKLIEAQYYPDAPEVSC